MNGFWDPKFELMPRSELEELQLDRLKRIVRYVYENVPFYRRRMKESGVYPEDIRSLEDIRKLPFTTKQDLRDNYPTGLLAVPLKKIVRFHASSGTTGKPTVVAYTERDIDTWSDLMARSLVACGVTKEDVMQVSYGYGLFTGGLGFHYGAERLGCAVIPTGAGGTRRQIMLIQDLRPTVLACTPSYAIYLGEEARKIGVEPSETNLRIGIFGAEPWSENTRKRIERMWGIDAYDVYGLSELCGPGVSIECTEKQGLHIWEDHFLVEVIDPETLEPVGEGERGELVFTTLTKEGMPLIRYRTRDISIVEFDKCSCGRTHARMMRVLGRSDDMIIVRGVNVFPSQIEEVLMKYPALSEHWMIVLTREGPLDKMKVEVEVVPEVFSDKMRDLELLKKQLEEDLHATLGLRVEVELVEPGSLPRFEGKARRVKDLREV